MHVDIDLLHALELFDNGSVNADNISNLARQWQIFVALRKERAQRIL